MSFNPSKCNTIHIFHGKGKTKSPYQYKLHGQIIESVASGKYLGVTISEKLTWSEHINSVAAKGKQKVGFLRRNFKECSQRTKAATFTTFVRPSLEYAACVWDPHLEKDKTPLEKVQRQAARYVFNSYTDRTPGIVTGMLENLQWKLLEERRKIIRLNMLYKIKNSLVCIPAESYVRASDPRTRGDRLFQQDAQHPIFGHTFFPQTTSDWNRLPNSVTTAPSLEVFHSRLGSPFGSAMGAP